MATFASPLVYINVNILIGAQDLVILCAHKEPWHMDDLEKKILDDIQKTGFASELRVISALLEQGWNTDHGETYEDKDENKSREIDITASKPAYDPQVAFRFNFTLVIEVKRSEQPWIVFTTDRKMKAAGWRIMHKSRNDRKQEDPTSPF